MSVSSAELDQAISALEGDLTAVPLPTAITLINSFQQQLRNAGDMELSSSLSELKMALTGNTPSAMVGRVLARVGAQTAIVAANAEDPEVCAKLIQLSQLLNSVGESLSQPRSSH